MLKLKYLMLVMHLHFGFIKPNVIPIGFIHHVSITDMDSVSEDNFLPLFCIHNPEFFPCALLSAKFYPNTKEIGFISTNDERPEILTSFTKVEDEYTSESNKHEEKITTTELTVERTSSEVGIVILAPKENEEDDSFQFVETVGKNCMERVIEMADKTFRLITCGIKNLNDIFEAIRQDHYSTTDSLVEISDEDKEHNVTTISDIVMQDYNSTITFDELNRDYNSNATLDEKENDNNITTTLKNSQNYDFPVYLDNEKDYHEITNTLGNEIQNYNYTSTIPSTSAMPNLVTTYVSRKRRRCL